MAIVVTGGAGFIGSCFLWKLNTQGIRDIIVVDELGTDEKWKNLRGKVYAEYMPKDVFLKHISQETLPYNVRALVHLGACSSTTEQDASYLMENNYAYSRALAEWALKSNVRFMYASSAATYGVGERGYSDDDEVTPHLMPLNMYGYSKHAFDLWVLKNNLQKRCVGLKFFNVYGPNEYHKEEMRSMVHKGYEQIKEKGKICLFKSYHDDYAHGEQKRDFIYVKDALEVMYFFLKCKKKNGIFNVGTGEAHSWNELAGALFKAMRKQSQIEYFDMPDRLKEKYQYFTQAEIGKLRDVGYDAAFTPLDDAVKDYVTLLATTKYL